MSLSKEKKSLISLSIILLIIVLAVVIMVMSLRTNPVKDKLKEEANSVKILFVLTDSENTVLATDVLFYYPKTNKCAIFNIPGNVGAIYQSIGRTDRIDAVYHELGMEAYCKEIDGLLGLKPGISFTIDVSLDNLGRLADLFGGMSVFVPTPVDYVSPDGEIWLLPSGAVTLDGDKLRTYMHYSFEDEADTEQLNRRQNVFIALLTAIRDNKLTLLEKRNFPLFSREMKTNVDEKGLLAIIESISNIETASLAPKTVTGLIRTVDGQELLFPMYNGNLIKEIVIQSEAAIMSTEEVSQNMVYAVEVQNGTNTNQLAQKTGELLSSAGYDVIQAINADSHDYAHTVVINHLGNGANEAATALASFINCKYIKTEPFQVNSNGAEVDFTIILGADFNGRYVIGGYTPPVEEEAAATTEE